MHGSDTRYVAMEIAADGSEKLYSPQGELLEEYTAEEAKVKPQMVEPYDKEKNCYKCRTYILFLTLIIYVPFL